MVQDKNLPEGTDKIIPGASAGTGEQGGAAGQNAALPPGGTGGVDQGGSTVTADTTLVSEREIPAPQGNAERNPTRAAAGDPRSATSGSERSEGGSLVEKVRIGGEKLSGQAADKARDLVSQGLDRSGEALSNVSRLIGDTATGLDERLGPEYGDYARRASEAIQNTAQNLRTKDPDELIEDTRNFVRKSPAVAIAGAAIVGFALARLVKSGIDAARDEHGHAGRSDEDDSA